MCEFRCGSLAVCLALLTPLLAQEPSHRAVALVKDIFPGPADSSINDLRQFNGYLVFTADDGVHGTELWKSDGTAAGTVMIKDINPGAGSSSPSMFSVVNGTLYFTADDGSHGPEWWKSDGTETGTALVADINPGAAGSAPTLLYYYDGSQYTPVFNGAILFTATDAAHGRELWKTDGTAAGTALVADVNPGAASSGISQLYLVNGRLIFEANDGASGTELWTTDGTAAGTALLKDINPGAPGSAPTFLSVGPMQLPVFNGYAYLAADDGSHGVELWRTDGTSAGTTLVKDLNPGAPGSSPDFFMAPLGSELLFTAADASHGRELWITDGTAAGTALLEDINSGVNSSTPVFQYLYDGFSASFSFHGVVVFTADDGVNGVELWKSDGTPGGTAMVQDINPGAAGSDPGSFSCLNGKLIFTGTHATYGRELFVSDLTAAGTGLLKDINPGVANSLPQDFNFIYTASADGGAAANALVFMATEDASGTELWVTDGTSTGTALLKDFEPGPGSSNPYSAFNAGRLVVTPTTTATGCEAWVTDGHAAGTSLLGDLNPGVASSLPLNFIQAGRKVFFTATTAGTGRELFAVDLSDVADPPLITSSLNQGGAVGAPFQYSITVRSVLKYSLSVAGLPPGLERSGNLISGTPTIAGQYSVTLSADNGAGMDTRTLVITIPGGGVSATGIDSDQDGFPDELEIALGGDPNSVASTPFGGSPAGVSQPFTVDKLAIKLNFAKSDRDSLQLSGVLPLTNNFVVAGQSLTVDVGGVIRSFKLDAKGKSSKGNDQAAVKPSRIGNARYQIKFSRGSFSALLADEGLTDADVKAQPRTVPVILLFNTQYFGKDLAQVYTATAGKFGKTALPRR